VSALRLATYTSATQYLLSGRQLVTAESLVLGIEWAVGATRRIHRVARLQILPARWLPYFDHLHGDQQATYLSCLARYIFLEQGPLGPAAKLYLLNKTLARRRHLFRGGLPEIFLLCPRSARFSGARATGIPRGVTKLHRGKYRRRLSRLGRGLVLGAGAAGARSQPPGCLVCVGAGACSSFRGAGPPNVVGRARRRESCRSFRKMAPVTLTWRRSSREDRRHHSGPHGQHAVARQSPRRSRREAFARRVIDRTRRTPLLDEWSSPHDHAGDDVLARHCAAFGWPVFRGSEDDVLDRYYQAAKELAPDVPADSAVRHLEIDEQAPGAHTDRGTQAAATEHGRARAQDKAGAQVGIDVVDIPTCSFVTPRGIAVARAPENRADRVTKRKISAIPPRINVDACKVLFSR